MKKTTSFVLLLAPCLAFFLLALSPSAFAQSDDEEENLVGYEQIVEELSAPRATNGRGATTRGRYSTGSRDPFESILLHGGVGLINTVSVLRYADGGKTYVNQRGFQAALGIDLFSENWLAEGTVRSFGEAMYHSTRISMKEFDLKFFYRNRLSHGAGLKLGGGLAARYLTVNDSVRGREMYTTPSSVATLGLDVYMSESVSVGMEVSARNTLIEETIDRSSIDAGLRVDTHF